MAFEAKIIKDSICNGHRLTTMQVTHPRIVHAEFNTHCMFARNASSSRAIPFSKMVQKVIDDPFIPIRFGKNQKGMQAFEYLEGMEREKAIGIWLNARDKAIQSATWLADMGIHKQIANRLLEPWMWITVCVTGDDGAWSNYFALRCHKDAEDNIQRPAYMEQCCYFENTPDELEKGDWHLPYLLDEEYPPFNYVENVVMQSVKVSVGRCARTSYLTQEGKRNFSEDIALHDRLTTHAPLHASPLEHVCKAMGNSERYGKYIGWKAYRHFFPREYVTDFKPNYQEYFAALEA